MSRFTSSHLIISSSFFFAAGLLFFAIYNQWILLSVPWSGAYASSPLAVIQKKEIVYHYFHGDKWKTEKQEMLWSDSLEKNIFHTINGWLTLLDEERIIAKKIALQSALISGACCAYLSFDNNLLGKEEIIFKKWMLIEGLLKTITANNIPIQQVQFLVHHQPLHDVHLDFSLPWPVHGFLKN